VAITAQSLGLFISTATGDVEASIVLAVLVMNTFMLLGGYFIQNIPAWIQWLQYVSPVTHSYSLLLHLEFTSDERFLCSEFLSVYPSCSMTSFNATTSPPLYVAYDDIIRKNGFNIPVYMSILYFVVAAFLLRLMAYLLLRFVHKPVNS